MNHDEAVTRLASALEEVARTTPLTHPLRPERNARVDAGAPQGDGPGWVTSPSTSDPTMTGGRGWLDGKLLGLAGSVVLIAVGIFLVGHQLGRGDTPPTERTTLPTTGTVVVPDLVGIGPPQPTTEAHATGLTVHIHDVRSTAPVAEVIAQAPPAGTRVPNGGIVTVEISDGDAPLPVRGATAVVPDVVGLAFDPALSALHTAGLTNSLASDLASCGVPASRLIVTAQAPAAGAIVPQDSPVSLAVPCP